MQPDGDSAAKSRASADSGTAATNPRVGEHEYRVSIEIEAWCDTDEEAEAVAARLADAADALPEVGKFECWVGRNHAPRA